MLSTKTLIIARHGEAGIGGLSSVGLRNTFYRAAYLDAYMSVAMTHPRQLDAIVHSPTERTVDTAKAFSRYFSKHVNSPDRPPVLKSLDILGSPFGFTFGDIAKDIPDEWNKVCLVSHAPNLTSLVYELAHGMNMNFNYGDAAILKFNKLRWSDIHAADSIKDLKGSAPIGQIFIPDLFELSRDL